MESQEDVSKKLVVTLLLLTVIVTFVGTLLIFSTLEEVKTITEYDGTSVGKVGINIQGPPYESQVIGTGQVGITIEEPPSGG